MRSLFRRGACAPTARPLAASVAVLLVMCVPARLHAASADSVRIARLTDYVDRLAAYGFSGQIVIAEQGHIVLQRAAGFADRRFEVPMTMETRLGIGSVTKAFVAAAILRLETHGKLSTSDRIDRWLPDVPADKAGITIAQLLSHVGGIRRDVPDIPDAAPRDDLVRAILAEPLADRPGGAFHYSNSGFDLLAAIVERASGTTFSAFARRELLEPAGMTATGTANTPELPDGPAARGYNEWKEVAAWTEWPAGWRGNGSGRMVSNALDLWRWAEAVQNGKALRAAEWQAMSTWRADEGGDQGYGYGMHLAKGAAGQMVLIMGGDVDGYRAEIRFYPDAQRIIVITTNEDQFGLGVQRRVIASALSRLAQNQSPPLPPAPARVGAREPAIGAWQLPTGGRVEIWNENGRLRLGARGQDAVDCFEPDPGDSTGQRAAIARKVETLMRAATRNDTTLAQSVLTPAEYAFAWPYLSRWLRAEDAVHDGLRSVTSFGIVSLPWDPAARRAYVQLKYADAPEDLFLGWQDGVLNDVTTGEGRPFPVLYPVAPLAEGGYATWDAIRQRAVRFRIVTPQGGAARLMLATPLGEVAAKRVR